MEMMILINAIIVDDENLAVDYLDAVLKRFDYLSIVGKYYTSLDALNSFTTNNEHVDIAFLDINMPELDGIELAQLIIEKSPHTKIVFTTGHENFAIEAFELSATDYLLKPITFNRIEKAINRCINQLKLNPKKANDTYTVCSFQSLTFIKNNNWTEPIIVRFRTTKVRSIFCYLLHYNSVSISKDVLVELFWPELDLEKAYTQLYNAIYQIRKSLADYHIPITIKNLEDSYTLLLNNVKYNVQLFKESFQNLPPVSKENIDQYKQILKYYRGDFLQSENYIWTESEREVLRLLWLQHIILIADFYEDHDNIKEAISLYLHLQSIDPYYEKSYVKLIQLYKKIGHTHFSNTQLEHLKKLLQDESDSKIIEDIYKELGITL